MTVEGISPDDVETLGKIDTCLYVNEERYVRVTSLENASLGGVGIVWKQH